MTFHRPLTATDLTTAALLSQGLTQKMIARRERISLSSVKGRVDTLLYKTGSARAVEAVHKIAKAGLLCLLMLMAPDDAALRRPRFHTLRVRTTRELRV
jgi:DNA-binding CsgD family transcriptional regulator